MIFDSRQTAAVLAGLRVLQQYLDRGATPPHVGEILNNGGECEPLDSNEIDALCEAVNGDSAELPVVIVKSNCAPVVTEVIANQPVKLVFVDEDTEGCEADTVGTVEGETAWVGVFEAETNGKRTAAVLKQVTRILEPPAPRKRARQQG